MNFAININDCRDDNDAGRTETRLAALFGGLHARTIGVINTYETAINLVDVLDASLGLPGIVLVNVAPRNGESRQWHNGSPFGYFQVGKTHVFTTITGYTLSLVKKLNLVKQVQIFDIYTVIESVAGRPESTVGTKAEARRIINTQFRSFEFLPRLAFWIAGKQWNVPHRTVPMSEFPALNGTLCWIDKVGGNYKTSSLPEEVGFKPRSTLHTRLGVFPCYATLKDVPDGEAAIVIGSSGYGEQRFLEIVVQGGRAADRFGLKTGDVIFG